MARLVFTEKYQQNQILEGNIIKREWIKYFRGNMPFQKNEYFVISSDIAMKSSALAGYSVVPALFNQARALHKKWRSEWSTPYLVIEDRGSGDELDLGVKRPPIASRAIYETLAARPLMPPRSGGARLQRLPPIAISETSQPLAHSMPFSGKRSSRYGIRNELSTALMRRPLSRSHAASAVRASAMP